MAKQKVKPEYEIPSKYKRTKQILDAGVGFGAWTAMKASVDADDSGSTTKAELMAYIEAHFQKGQWKRVFEAHNGNGNWKNLY